MDDEISKEVTRLLFDWSSGDDEALAKLMPLVCDELRSMARRCLRREERGHILQTTALVNEFYLRLRGLRAVNWKNRAHFFGYASQTMRRLLVDFARKNQAAKRGDGIPAVSLQHADRDISEQIPFDVIALNDALTGLEKMDPRQARVVELRYYVGLDVEETAAALEISTATVKRDWKVAKLWLYREVKGRNSE